MSWLVWVLCMQQLAKSSTASLEMLSETYWYNSKQGSSKLDHLVISLLTFWTTVTQELESNMHKNTTEVASIF